MTIKQSGIKLQILNIGCIDLNEEILKICENYLKVRYFCFRGTFLRRNSDLIRFRTKPMQYILKLNKFDPKGSLRLTMAGHNNFIVLIFKQWITNVNQ